MFGIGSTELAIILLFAFLILGPDKLPAFAKTLGRAIAKFRDVQDEVNNVVKQEIFDPATDKGDPLKKPLAALDKLTAESSPVQPTESFAERKARYDRERAERRARQAAERAAAAEAEDEAPAPVEAPRPAVSAEELYGISAKPKPKPRAEEADGGER